MKKQILAVLFTLLACPHLQARHGGGAVAGALGGLAVGTMIGSAAAKDSGRSSRAEQEAIRAQDKAEQVRIEQERQRLSDMERRDLERRISETRGNSTFVILIALISLLMFAVVGLGILVMKRKP